MKIINQKLTDFYNEYYKDKPVSNDIIKRNIKAVCKDYFDKENEELLQPLIS